MKYVFVFVVCLLVSCNQKWKQVWTEKGYDIKKDTVIIKDYEFFIKRKGYVPLTSECKFENRLQTKISITGYEQSDTIPVQALEDSLEFTVSDKDIREILKGSFFLFNGVAGYAQIPLRASTIDNYKLSVATYIHKNNFRKRSGNFLLLFCVLINKGGVQYVMPTRRYYIKPSS